MGMSRNLQWDQAYVAKLMRRRRIHTRDELVKQFPQLSRTSIYRVFNADDPGELHRRRVLDAFAAEGRCGRWSALAALGATIRAWPAGQLDTFAPYRSPRPLEHRIRPSAGGDALHARYENYVYDPEDGPEQAPEPQPVKRRRIRQLVR
jgi:hypothetical protein